MDIAYDQNALDDLLVDIPNPIRDDIKDENENKNEDEHQYIFGFEINEEIELRKMK